MNRISSRARRSTGKKFFYSATQETESARFPIHLLQFLQSVRQREAILRNLIVPLLFLHLFPRCPFLHRSRVEASTRPSDLATP